VCVCIVLRWNVDISSVQWLTARNATSTLWGDSVRWLQVPLLLCNVHFIIVCFVLYSLSQRLWSPRFKQLFKNLLFSTLNCITWKPLIVKCSWSSFCCLLRYISCPKYTHTYIHKWSLEALSSQVVRTHISLCIDEPVSPFREWTNFFIQQVTALATRKIISAFVIPSFKQTKLLTVSTERRDRCVLTRHAVELMSWSLSMIVLAMWPSSKYNNQIF